MDKFTVGSKNMFGARPVEFDISCPYCSEMVPVYTAMVRVGQLTMQTCGECRGTVVFVFELRKEELKVQLYRLAVAGSVKYQRDDS